MPQAASSRVEAELMLDSNRALAGNTDLIEKIRLLCLSRGASGVMALGRFVTKLLGFLIKPSFTYLVL